MIIKTQKGVYGVSFGQFQIEITGQCNMYCKHCRNSFDRVSVMPVKQIIKIIKLAIKNGDSDLELVLSGGEPLTHPDFKKIIAEIKKLGIKSLFITTNGSLLSEEHIALFKDIKNIMISVSLDDIDPKKNDVFRGFVGAHNRALSAINLLVGAGIKTSMRVSLRPEKIKDLEKIAEFAYRLKINRLSVAGIFPSGKARENKKLLMTPSQKKEFLTKLFKLRDKYLPKGLKISTNEPLQNICRSNKNNCSVPNTKNIILNGCSAAASFNVMANGDLTPCAMLNLPIPNTYSLTLKEIESRYKSSDIIKNILDMNIKGKCGSCNLKYSCGGCRARALAKYGDYLAQDPDCWI